MNSIKRFPVFEILLVAVILVTHTYAALSDAYNMPNAWFSRDDAYYYFKVAQNITEGRGSTFDGINLTNGYHPLWMLVCIPIFALARFDLILPLRILLMVMAVLNAATAVLIYRLVRRVMSQPVAMLAASFWAFDLYIHYTVYEFGLETPLAAFVVVLLLDRLSRFEAAWRAQTVTRRQIAILAILATLAMFSRLDLVFFAVIVGIWILFRGHPIRFLLPLDVLIVFVSMVSAFALRAGFETYYSYVDSITAAIVLGVIVKVVSLYFFGAYQHPRSTSVGRLILKTALAVTAGLGVLIILMLVLDQLNLVHSFPRAALILDWLTSLVLILALRLAARWFSEDRSADLSPHPLEELKANWRIWLAEGAVYYGIVGGALLAYMLFNKLVFGTGSPVSGQIKQWWGSLGQTVYERPPAKWADFLGLGFRNEYDTWRPLSLSIQQYSERLRPLIPGSNMGDERYYFALAVFALAALLVFFLFRRRTLMLFTKAALLPLVAAAGIQILYYTTLGYSATKEWYWVSQMTLVVLAGAAFIELLARPILKVQLGYVVGMLASIWLSVTLASTFRAVVAQKMPRGHFPPDRPFMEVLPFIEEMTPAGSVIGMTGGGNVGYFIHDRTIVNMDGLINSYDYFQALQQGKAATYLKERGMDIVFANPFLLDLAPYNGQFAPYLESYDEYGGKDFMYLLDEPGD